MKSSLSALIRRPAYRFALLASCGLAAILAAWIAWPTSRGGAPAPGPLQAAAIVARGRIEPATRVHAVYGPSTGGTVEQLMVSEGSRVRAGDVLAVLDTHDLRAAELATAQRDLDLAQLELAQVVAGAKSSEILAQRALAGVRQAQVRHAQAQLDRARSLLPIGATSSAELEQDQMDLAVAQRQLREATARVTALTEVRPVDEQVGRARVAQAQARLSRARAEMDRCYVRAPIDGTVLALTARTGAAIGPDGLLTMGNLDHPIVVAEIDESDVLRVRPGGDAVVALRNGAELTGKVTKVLNQVFLNERPTMDVLKGRDARVVEAEIALGANQDVPRVAGLEVTVSLPGAALRR